MSFPFEYDTGVHLPFGGVLPHVATFDASKVVILPVPVDRTTSYVGGTRNGPREILVASSHMELWDEEVGADVHGVGMFTLPEMELPFGELPAVMDEIRRVAYEVIARDKFLITLGGEHSITPPLVAAAAQKFPNLSVLQVDAHADLRSTYMGTIHNHACAMRRVLDYASLTQVGIRSMSTEEAEAVPELKTNIFYDATMRRDPQWVDRVVDTLQDPVYITIDVDGMDPAIMPATGTPEPGGLSWYEMLALLKATLTRKRVVACDLVELSPLSGLVAPNFLCSKLIYKIITYQFARGLGSSGIERLHQPVYEVYYRPTVATPDLLGQAVQALDRGRGSEATTLLVRALRKPGLGREEQIQIRCALADAWLLQDDIRQATEALGRPPEARERLDPARVSDLWRMHGRLAAARGEPSRGIAFLTKALQAAERAHDSRAIGLAHFELGLCYRQVGDTAIVREHLTQAASALHAVGDRRHLAMVHSLSGITLAQEGRLDEAMSALSQAERLALLVEAGDVLATVCGNQANVALMQHRHEQALTLAERSVELQQQGGTPHGLGVALASLGQICVRLGSLNRAEEALNRALDVRSPLQFMRETTGAVFDTLAQIHLIRGEHEAASRCLQKAREAYGEYGSQTSRWYQWSLLVLESRLALRRGQPGPAVALASDVAKSPEAPPAYVLQGELIAVESLMASNLNDEAQRRLDAIAGRINPVSMSGTWGEFLRLRGRLHRAFGRSTEAYHDFGQSVSVFELLGERHQAGLSYLELGRLAAAAGAKSRATRYLSDAVAIFDALGAAPDLAEARQALGALPAAATGGYVGVQMDGEDALVRRIVDAAVMPALLAREGATALLEACDAEVAVLFVQLPAGQVRVASASGCDADAGRALAASALRINDSGSGIGPMIEPLGRDVEGPRFAVVSGTRPFQGSTRQRFRTLCAVLRQGFDLCAARDRQTEAVGGLAERPLEPLLPGFVCASAAMQRVVEQIQRMQGNDLTVLITGESGTGKDLVARAIHSGSLRRGSMFLPYNCTSATRELADSQLFGHRRGSFTGAIADQPGVLRTAVGGTLFLDEVGDLPLDVQPKLLRFLEQGEVLPVGDTRPQRVDVRVVAATNADLEQRVADGTFREDLFYRLSVIRIHVPPLRDRREEIPHLSTFFLREASERLGKPGVRLSAETLDLFDSFQWPGNVRQLRNEVQRAVAMALPGGLIKPDLLSPVFSAAFERTTDTVMRGLGRKASLSSAVESLERDLIEGALEQAAGNISETARSLGLTRRGLYLKMQRLGVSAARL